VQPETALSLTWEVDGRQIRGGFRHVNRTRRIHVSWQPKGQRSEDIYLLFVAPDTGRLHESGDRRFLGRAYANAAEMIDLMKGWVEVCATSHGQNCQAKHGTKGDFVELAGSTYFGVVDVKTMQLKQLPIKNGEPRRYVAVSYVWGKPPDGDLLPYTTSRSNIMIRIQRDGLKAAWEQLPRTIQDAVLLVEAMGERYMWIDSLCIVQDSGISWALNAKAMHLVYGNAHFTICAADGDATTGLKAVGSILRQSKKTGATAEETAFQGRYEPLSTECLPGIRLLVSRPPEAVIQDATWSRRGWTFQERLLSPRCLIFAEGQVYFQCRSAVMSQNTFSDGGTNGWSLDWTNSPLRTLGELRKRAFWFYMTCVRLYTGRELSRAKDILTAFQGTSWLLTKHLNAPLLYGLPTSHFDLALLWVPLQALDRRICKGQRSTNPSSATAACSQDSTGHCSCPCRCGEEGYRTQEFPSWSWCGWMGGVMAYEHDMVEGCLLNVQEWLRDHTWILWYVRDHEGNLRPLWDRTVLREDLSEESRWRGYAGRDLHDRSFPSKEPVSSIYPLASDPGRGVSSLTNSDDVANAHGVNPFLNLRRRFQMSGRQDRPVVNPASLPPHLETNWSRQSNKAYLKRLPAGYYDDANNRDDGASVRDLVHVESNTVVPTLTVPIDKGISSVSQGLVPKSASTPAANIEQEKGASVRSSRYSVRPVYRPGTVTFNDEPFNGRIPNGMGPSNATTRVSTRRDRGDHEYVHGNESNEPFGPKRGAVMVEDEDEDEPQRQQWSRLQGEDSGESDDSNNWEPEYQLDESYGRTLREGRRRGTNFTAILPDNPFGITRGPFSAGSRDWASAHPILQFWTWRTELHVKIRQEPWGPDGPVPSSMVAVSKNEANRIHRLAVATTAPTAMATAKATETTRDRACAGVTSSTVRATGADLLCSRTRGSLSATGRRSSSWLSAMPRA